MARLTPQMKEGLRLLGRTPVMGGSDYLAGWSKCTKPVYDMLVATMPSSLVQFDHDYLLVRMTNEGKAVHKWVC